MTDFAKQIWDFVDEMRSQSVHLNVFTALKHLQQRGVALDANSVRYLATKLDQRSFVTEFIIDYLSDVSPRTILDPSAGLGGMLIPLVRHFNPSNAVGLLKNPVDHEIATLLSEDVAIEWQLEDQSASLATINTQLDVAVSSLPWATQTRTHEMVATNGDRIEISDAVGNLIMLKASQMLKPSGSGFFVVPPGFFYQSSLHGVYLNLERFNLFVNAALKLPKDALAPHSKIGGYLIVLTRHKQPSLFVAELTLDARSNKVVLANLRARKEGQALQLGVFTDVADFTSFEALLRQGEIENIAAEKDLVAFNLSEISTINFVKSPESFAEAENTVYLPLIGNRPAVTSIERLALHHHNVAQLIVDPAQANAQYLASFFSGPIGRKVRDSLLSSSMIPKINRSSLRSATVYLPKKGVQDEIAQIDSSIEDLSTRLASLQRELWKNPRNREKIQQEIKTITPTARKDCENWIETLPRPLATILGAYRVADRPDQKVAYLVNFFEAFTVFNASVLLSVYEKDAFFAEQLKTWLKKKRFKPEKLWQREFGSWKLLLDILAGKTRALLDDDSNRDTRLELFGNVGGDDLFKLLADDRLGPVLAEALIYRRACAHDPAPSEATSRTRLKALESCLSKLRGIAADQYENVLFFSPLDNKYRSGVFRYRVQKLSGTGLHIGKVTIDTLTQLEDEKLHLAYIDQNRAIKPIELLPFIEFGPVPESQKNAFYFYDSVDPKVLDSQAEYVSYDLDVDGKVPIPGNTQAIIDAISKLKSES
jgi:hypothetical protein